MSWYDKMVAAGRLKSLTTGNVRCGVAAVHDSSSQSQGDCVTAMKILQKQVRQQDAYRQTLGVQLKLCATRRSLFKSSMTLLDE